MIPASSTSPSLTFNATTKQKRILQTIYNHHLPFYASSPIVNIENTTSSTITANIINIEKNLDQTPKTNHININRLNQFKFQQENLNNYDSFPSSPSNNSENENNNNSPMRYKSTSSYKQFNHCKLKLQSSPYHLKPQHQQNINLNDISCSPASQSAESPSSGLLYNLKHQLTTNTSTYNTSEENLSNNNLSSSISVKTNPPTTPISASFTDNNNSETADSSPVVNHNQFKQPQINKSIQYVTPASTTTETSPTNSNNNRILTSKQVSLTNSSTHTTYSRSSSMTSLSSFDIKSTYSSATASSEYSSCNNKNGFETPASGYSDLPDSPGQQFNVNQHNYFINNFQQQQQQYFKQINPNLFKFHQPLLFQQQYQAPNEETSILTVDSNPKSNDITVVERTVINSNFNNMAGHNESTCSNDSKHQGSSHLVNTKYCGTLNKTNSQNSTLTLNDSCKKVGSSAYNSQSNSFLAQSNSNNIHILVPKGDNEEEEEDVVTYDQEGSIVNDDARSTISSRSNVSCLSFPNEPCPDLDFIRKILASRKSSLNNTSSSINTILTALPQQQQQQQQIQQPIVKHAWSTMPTYTPPIKLNNNTQLIQASNKPPIINETASIIQNQNVNRSLFNNKNNDNYVSEDESSDFFLKYADIKKNEIEKEKEYLDENIEDDDKPMSIASVPSEIRLDLNQKPNNFEKLFTRLNNNNNPIIQLNYKNSNNMTFDSPNILNNWNKNKLKNEEIIEYNQQDSSMNEESIYNNKSTNNTYNVPDEDKNDEEEEDDEKILNEFIDEVFPIALAANTTCNDDEEQEDEEQEERKENSFQYEYDENQEENTNNSELKNYDCNNMRLLPKIEEVDEEEEENSTKHLNKKLAKNDHLKRLSFSKTISTSSISSNTHNSAISSNINNSQKLSNIPMTKTARLRLEQQQKLNGKINRSSKLSTSVATKRQAPTSCLNENKKTILTTSKTKTQVSSKSNLNTNQSNNKKPVLTFSTTSQKNLNNGFNFNLRK